LCTASSLFITPGNGSFWSGLVLSWRLTHFLFCHHKISELRWPIIAKFCIVIKSVQFYNSGPKLQGALNKKILGAKASKIWHDFRQYSKSDK